MAILPFALTTREGHSIAVDSERVVNMYTEFSEGGKTLASLNGRPGLDLWVDVGAFPARGLWETEEALYGVFRKDVLRFEASGAFTNVGQLDSTEGRVSMSDNGKELMIVDGTVGGGYIYNYVTPAFQKIADANFATLTPTSVTYQDTYFIVNNEGTLNYYLSGNFDGLTWPAGAANVGTAEKDPDSIVSLISDHAQLILFGTKTIEVHYNVGSSPFPFTRAEGVQIEIGLAAPLTMKRFDNSIVFLGRSKEGALRVYRFVGNNVQRISSDSLERSFTRTELVNASAAVIAIAGHEFYVLNLPLAGSTRVYDAALASRIGNEAWQEWSSGGEPCGCHEFLSDHSVAFVDETYVADPHSGKVYRVNPDTNSDNGEPFATVARTSHITNSERRTTHTSFEVIMERGVGLVNKMVNGHDPQAVLRWSNDNGYTWSSEHRRPVGKLGQYYQRIKWNRLGRVRDRVYEWAMDSPVKRVVVGMKVNDFD